MTVDGRGQGLNRSARRFSVAAILAAVATASCARSTATPTPAAQAVVADGAVVLHNGMNDVALLGDGTPGEVLVTWRGNYNAHGFSVATFAIRAGSDLDNNPIWQTLPFYGGPHDGETGREIYRTAEGADCTLSDLRVVPHAGRPVEVVIASRPLGTSFADAAEVRFDYYRVVHNRDGVVGWPPTYFQFERTERARATYCDVNEAFNRELHLGTTGLGHAEGGR